MDSSNNTKTNDVNISSEIMEQLQEELKKHFGVSPSGTDTGSVFDQEDLRDPSEFEDPLTPKKLIACAHEIIFNITAHVMQENERGEVTNSVEICTKNFHIPVPFNKDYKSYMKTFFDHLETSILNTIQETNDKAEEIEND